MTREQVDLLEQYATLDTVEVLKEAQQALRWRAIPLVEVMCKKLYGHDEPAKPLRETLERINKALEEAS